MKCISLWQPWATLLSLGEKQIETRNWKTNIRGIVAIHAAKRKWDFDIVRYTPFVTVLRRYTPNKDGCYFYDDMLKEILPLGCIIAVGELKRCIEITPENTPDGYEYAFGNYTPGRFAWLFANVKKIEPIPYKGHQGFFDIPDDLVS